MVQLSDDSRPSEKALDPAGVASLFAVEYLDGYSLMRLTVQCLPDVCKTTTSEQGQKQVAALAKQIPRLELAPLPYRSFEL
jgi:hypothetical protein